MAATAARVGGREFRGIERGEVREERLVLLAQLRVPGFELPALVLIDVAGIDVGDGVAGVEEIEKKCLGGLKRAGFRGKGHAGGEAAGKQNRSDHGQP